MDNVVVTNIINVLHIKIWIGRWAIHRSETSKRTVFNYCVNYARGWFARVSGASIPERKPDREYCRHLSSCAEQREKCNYRRRDGAVNVCCVGGGGRSVRACARTCGE